MIKECADGLVNKLKTIAEDDGKLHAKEYLYPTILTNLLSLTLMKFKVNSVRLPWTSLLGALLG